jgi:hypothetical protein
MLIVFNPHSGARAELSRDSTGSTLWSGTVSLKGRQVASMQVHGATCVEALAELAQGAVAGYPMPTGPTDPLPPEERGIAAIRGLVHEL